MKRAIMAALLLAASIATQRPVHAKGYGSSGGLTLDPTSARASALGDSFTSVIDDITAMGYNPASLRSLTSGQASFMHQKGLVDDSFSQFMVGAPLKRGGMGLSLGHYDGGELALSDGFSTRNVKAQSDFTLSLGLARQFGRASIGVNGKYLSSELADTARAQAFAADFGLSIPVNNRVRFGAALQNIGTQLKYEEEGDNLPRTARSGLSITMFPSKLRTTLMLDMAYLMNEQIMQPSVGVETTVGPLALRAGYKKGDLHQFSLGTGFSFGKTSLDYAFGLVNQLNSQHRISFSMRFGGGAPNSFAKTPSPLKINLVNAPSTEVVDR